MGDEIIKVLDALCEKFGIVIDWTSANVFPYLEELCGKFIKWEIGTSIAWIAIGIIVIILTGIGIKFFRDEVAKCFCIGIMICAFICVGKQVFDIVTCCTFPEKAIYDYIYWNTNLLK